MNPQDLKTKTKVLIGVSLPLIFVVILGFVAAENIKAMNKAAEQVDETQLVLAGIDAIGSAALDMETGMRGYLLAGKEGFLAPYEAGKLATFDRITRLKEKIKDRPEQLQRLRAVETVMQNWQSEVAHPMIELRRQIGHAKTMDDIADLVGEGRGKVFFDRLRGEISALIESKRRRLEQSHTRLVVSEARFQEQILLSRESDGWVVHTHQVLAKVDELRGIVLGLEAALRGYFLSDIEDFLESYQNGSKALLIGIKLLQSMVSDNPEQLALVNKSSRIISNWMTHVAQLTVQLKREAFTNLSVQRGYREGKKVLKDFYQVMAEITSNEKSLLTSRQVVLKQSQRQVDDYLEQVKQDRNSKDQRYFIIGAIRSLLASTINMETGMRGYLLSGRDEFLEPYKKAELEFQRLYAMLVTDLAGQPLQLDLLRAVRYTLLQWQQKIAEPTIKLRHQIGDEKTMNDMSALVGEARGKGFFDKFRGLLADLRAQEETLMRSLRAQNETLVQATRDLMFNAVSVILLLGLGLAWLIGRNIAAPIRGMTIAMQKIAGGELNTQVPGFGRQDEVGEMADAVEVFRENSIVRQSLEKERELAERKIKAMNESLEQKVKERTASLNQEVEERRIADAELRKTLDNLLRTQKSLVESEKMASLGNLVAGVAHEINTPLGISLTAASNLRERTASFSELYHLNQMKRKDLQEFVSVADESSRILESNLHRSSDLVRSFKQVAVDQLGEHIREIDLAEYVDQVLLSLKPELKKKSVVIELAIEESLVFETQPGALSQILTNLIVNSLVHAYDEGEKGTIHLSAKEQDKQIVLGYEDDGKGMMEAVVKNIFEPFFTTNRGGGGSGLGMHLLYNLVSQSLGGTVTCDSAPGRGTKFKIIFPIDITAVTNQQKIAMTFSGAQI